MKKGWIFIIILFSLFALSFIVSLNIESIIKLFSNRDFIGKNSKEMTSAIEQAREDIDTLIKYLGKRDSLDLMISLKGSFEESEKSENLWIGEVSYDSTGFHGVIESTPQIINSIKKGDTVSIGIQRVIDWSVIKGNRLIGGYIIRAQREKMSDKEKEAFDSRINFIID